MLSVNGQHLSQDGHPFFYMADTCWSAFTNIKTDDWRHYLKKRKQQGFNVIQINVLRQWDASSMPAGSKIYEPFAVKQVKGTRVYDYKRPSQEYFDHAAEMLSVMREYGLTPALILLWCNYLPDTWVHGMAEATNVMPLEDVNDYVTYVVKRFKEFEPVYFASGDTDFPANGIAETYYKQVIKSVRKNDENALISMHIAGETAELPKEMANEVDFFSYQSGHGRDGQNTSWSIPLHQRDLGWRKPIVNAEVCYEYMPKFSREMNTRYTNKDLANSSWHSILGGADAGIAYGAHGIWSWHNEGENFLPGYPYPADWHDALNFPGASDIAFIKYLLDSLGNPELENVLVNEREIIAKSKQGDLLMIYTVANQPVVLKDAELWTVSAVNLDTRRVYTPEFKEGAIYPLQDSGAYLFICQKIVSK